MNYPIKLEATLVSGTILERDYFVGSPARAVSNIIRIARDWQDEAVVSISIRSI